MTRPLSTAQKAARQRAKAAPRRVVLVNAADRKIEFVCSVCLHSVVANDTDRWPRCWRGHGKLTPDSDEVWIRPQTLQRQETLRKKAALVAPAAATGRPGGKPVQRRRAQAVPA